MAFVVNDLDLMVSSYGRSYLFIVTSTLVVYVMNRGRLHLVNIIRGYYYY